MADHSPKGAAKKLFESFDKDALNLKSVNVRVSGRNKDVRVSKSEVQSRLSKIHPKREDKFLDALSDHFEYFERQLAFASSPQAFRHAWDLRSKEVSLHDVERILSAGGSLVPNMSENQLFQYNNKGLIVGPSHQGLLIGVRHSEGNYNDILNELGQFTYQPPEDLSGMLRYRFYEYFEKHFGIPYVMFVSMWFSYNNSYKGKFKDKMPKETNWLYVVAPVKVISLAKVSNSSISNPLRLQVIRREEAFEVARQIKSLSTKELETPFRPTLKNSLSFEFSYNHIKSSQKGLAIKKWAQKCGKSCPSCDTAFSSLVTSKIHFGHILSQSWCSSFGFLQDKVHDPDNLYLSCSKCNISLGKKFPSLSLREKIVSSSYGTVGDWLRGNEKKIRSFIK